MVHCGTFLQIGRLDQALILLGLALNFPSVSASLVFIGRNVQKTEIWFGVGILKNRIVQKFDICSAGFPIETACSLPLVIKSE